MISIANSLCYKFDINILRGYIFILIDYLNDVPRLVSNLDMRDHILLHEKDAHEEVKQLLRKYEKYRVSQQYFVSLVNNMKYIHSCMVDKNQVLIVER